MPAKRFGFGAILLGLASIILLGMSVWGYRQGGWPWPQSFQVATWSVWVALAGCVIALFGLVALLRSRVGGGAVVGAGLLLSLPIAALGLAFDLSARVTAPINDISTDLRDPPVFWSTRTPSEYPSANAELQRAAYPEVQSLDLDLDFDTAFGLARALVEESGWEVLSADPDDGQVEAIATSWLYGFEDEVAIRVVQSSSGVRVDMRSRSRIGLVDRGANARRITRFLSNLKERS